MNEKNKRFGLIIPNKPESNSVKNAFKESESEEEETVSSSNWLELSLKAKKKQTRIDIARALQDDPTVYQYDEIYDDMQEKKAETEKMKKPAERKPRYIQHLMAQANRRKQENERRLERQIQKERDEEGDEFADKESYVTPSYKKKLEQMKLFEEEELRLGMLEDIADVSKQKDMTGFYRHLYRSMTSDKLPHNKEIISKTAEDKTNDEENNDLVRNNKNDINIDRISGNNNSNDNGSSSDNESGNYEEDNSDDKSETENRKRKLIRNDESFRKRIKNNAGARQYRAYKKEQSPCADVDKMEIRKSSSDGGSNNNTVKFCKNNIPTTIGSSSSSSKQKKSTNLDSDTSLSSESSSSDNEDNSSSLRTVKLENKCSNDKEEDNKEKTQNADKKIDVEPPSVEQKKVDIWAKRTVELLFEQALERYLQRKARKL